MVELVMTEPLASPLPLVSISMPPPLLEVKLLAMVLA